MENQRTRSRPVRLKGAVRPQPRSAVGSSSEEAIAHLSKADKVLAQLIRKVGPCGLRPRYSRSPFEALAKSIVYQQLNGIAAATILGRVKALFPARRFPGPEDLLAMAPERLRSAGLSRAKLAALQDLSAKTLAGLVPNSRAIARMPNEEILERLTLIRGVGAWTVEMLLIFTLGRPDVLPVTDYGVRKGFARTYAWDELPTPNQLSEFGERWRPHRSTAAWYFWRATEMA